MKKYTCFLIVIFILTGCNSCDYSSTKSELSSDMSLPEEISIAAFYEQLPDTGLPLTSDEMDGKVFTPVPLAVKESLSPYDRADSDIYARKLPEKGNERIWILLYKDGRANPVLVMNTFTTEMQMQDRLLLGSTESVEGTTAEIRRSFRISADYIITVYKYLENTLIEQLAYRIDENGFFSEIRDGRTPVIAFETFDDIHYIVESFVWDYRQGGGLYKKNLLRRTFRINPDNTVIQTE